MPLQSQMAALHPLMRRCVVVVVVVCKCVLLKRAVYVACLYCLTLVLSALCSQIKKLNAEIRGYTQQLKRVKGAAARGIKQRAVQALKRKKM